MSKKLSAIVHETSKIRHNCPILNNHGATKLSANITTIIEAKTKNRVEKNNCLNIRIILALQSSE
jgi:hypothetical protein